MSLAARCIASRTSTVTAPPPIKVNVNEVIHSGSVPVDQIDAKILQASLEFERRLKEDVRVFLELKVPQDIGTLVNSYIQNWMKRDIFGTGIELTSEVSYAPHVEAAVGKNWQKGTAVDQAIEMTRQHILNIYPAILKLSYTRVGLDVEVQHIGL